MSNCRLGGSQISDVKNRWDRVEREGQGMLVAYIRVIALIEFVPGAMPS